MTSLSFDHIDRKILAILQNDASLSTEALAQRVNLSKNACWRRVKILEQSGVIARRVAVLDPVAVGLGLKVLVAVRCQEHSPQWLEGFEKALHALPQIISAYRTSGDVDYMLTVRVKDVAGYDAFYKDLISRVSGLDLSATFVMEEIKDHDPLPV